MFPYASRDLVVAGLCAYGFARLLLSNGRDGAGSSPGHFGGRRSIERRECRGVGRLFHIGGLDASRSPVLPSPVSDFAPQRRFRSQTCRRTMPAAGRIALRSPV
jgi:hypothetical protein